MSLRNVRIAAALSVVALLLAACGGDEGPAQEPVDGVDERAEDAHGDGMAMGDADVTPADEIAGAEVERGTFAVLDGAPEDSTVTGEALLARHDGGTTVTLRLEGLDPDRAYVSHVHVASCAEGAGPHYKHDPGAGDDPPNEIHLAFTPDGEGTIQWSVENPARAGDDAVSVVVHEDVEGEPKVICADLA